ncbi:peptidoglycan recognition protein family protein [Streptomyces anulatus]|uniref:peptidoglycan recognition protein family protein n=1 Tax=Streptomyces anulatus TaxID=1892 RepID=UPI00368A3C22
MAWYPRAKKLELQPESDAQQAIRPTQLILHSIVANWTARRTYEFWRDSTNLESHFGIGYGDRDIAQYIGTETRADANAGANRRSDGSGAISVETASNSKASDPWNASQVEELIALGVWAHQRHGIPLRICRTSGDPGFGYHSMFAAWSTSGTACPGPARIKQFKTVVFPGIVARATGKTSAPRTPTAPPKNDKPTAPATAVPVEDPMPAPTTLHESVAGGPDLPAGEWTELPAAEDTAILRGPCTYDVGVSATLSGTGDAGRVQMRFVHVDIETRRRSAALPVDVYVRGGDTGTQVSRRGALPAGQYLKIEALADGTGAAVTHRTVDGLVWR